MARRYFGTDGVRGVVGQDLTAELVQRLGKATTLWSKGGRVFVGRDTRGSGPELEEAFARGVVEADPNLREPLKRAGFLKRDARIVERKKAGLHKARKAPQFSKR